MYLRVHCLLFALRIGSTVTDSRTRRRWVHQSWEIHSAGCFWNTFQRNAFYWVNTFKAPTGGATAKQRKKQWRSKWLRIVLRKHTKFSTVCLSVKSPVKTSVYPLPPETKLLTSITMFDTSRRYIFCYCCRYGTTTVRFPFFLHQSHVYTPPLPDSSFHLPVVWLSQQIVREQELRISRWHRPVV